MVLCNRFCHDTKKMLLSMTLLVIDMALRSGSAGLAAFWFDGDFDSSFSQSILFREIGSL